MCLEAGLKFERNTGPNLAAYDYSHGHVLVEVKGNPAARKTGNVAVEEDILEISKAHYFLIAFPVISGWHGTVLSRNQLYNLLTATKLTQVGRFYRYPRVPGGEKFRDGTRKISALIPTGDITAIGTPVNQFIKTLKQ